MYYSNPGLRRRRIPDANDWGLFDLRMLVQIQDKETPAMEILFSDVLKFELTDIFLIIGGIIFISSFIVKKILHRQKGTF